MQCNAKRVIMNPTNVVSLRNSPSERRVGRDEVMVAVERRRMMRRGSVEKSSSRFLSLCDDRVSALARSCVTRDERRGCIDAWVQVGRR